MKKRFLAIIVSLLMILLLPAGVPAADVYGTDENGTIIKIENDITQMGIGKCESVPITVEDEYASSSYDPATWRFYAACPEIVGFFDYKGMYNVVYTEMGESWTLAGIVIQRYDTAMRLNSTIRIPLVNKLFGNITTDNAGNYYVVWGQSDDNSENCVVITVCKYDYSGKLKGKCEITGYDSGGDDYWGTKIPFDAGNCSLAINNGVLACNYAREMYSGHQSNYVFYVDCATMDRIVPDYDIVPYVSHSFDQRTLPTSDGGFIVLNHGDAYGRGFCISKIDSDLTAYGNFFSFHFREGSDRSHGYNETYAQLGGIAETDNAYVFCGSSERTLSLALAPTQSYCGHNEARDLFVQILKKDFYEIYDSEENKFLVKGEVRKATGTRPESGTTENQLYLSEDEVDYGVIWLTDYDDEHYAGNPHVVSIGNGKTVILWEKRSYTGDIETYFAIIKEDGTYSVKPTLINNVELAGNIPPVYRDGKIYWTTVDNGKGHINKLTVSVDEVVLDTPVVKAANDAEGVKITWNKISDAQGYYIYRKTTNGKYQQIAVINSSDTLKYVDTSAVSGTNYTYTVGAFNKNGNYVTTYYDEGSYVKYIRAPKITAITATSSGIEIVWNKSAGADCYRVFRKGSNGNWEKLGDTTGNTYLDKNTDENTTYTYTVRCMAANKKSYTSSCVTKGWSYTGMALCNGAWRYISNGKINKTYTGMAKNAYGWWYMKNGQLDRTYTGMAKNAYGWWYMKNGKLDTTYTGMAKNAYGWWYMKNGQLDRTYTGMAKNAYGWWYMKNGQLDRTYTGMAKNEYGWWYMEKGTINFKYTGIAKNAYGTWYMQKGKLDTSFTGKVMIDGKTYNIVDGKVK